MIKFFKKLVWVAMLATIGMGQVSAESPKREMRSSWLTTVSNIDWPSTKGTTASAQAAQKKELLEYLNTFEAWNMTGTCLHVRSMADAMYPSEYAPWSSYISGKRGVSPGWDPLAYFVEECHKRGLEAYVWLNPYRWTTSTQWSTDMDKEWLEKDMIISNDDGDFYTFNPALPETRELFINVIKELLNNYAIDGLLFDDYFYPGGGTTESSSAPDYDNYKASGTTLSIGDWRRANVNQMVKDCYETIKELRPDVRFGIGPAGVSNKSASKYGLPSQSSYGSSASDWQYAQIYADPLTWMYEGTIDFIAPQLYWETTHSTNAYGALTHWWSDVAEILNCHCYISQASYKVNNSGWGINEIIDQVEINRQYAKNNNCGAIFYNSNTLVDYCSALADDVYSAKVLSPEITWKSGPKYGKVSNLAYNNGTLTWNATTNGNAIIRYTVYAVPTNVTIDAAQAANGDGIDVKYLQKVVYGTSYTVDSDKQSGYWYAVCVFDGYSKEHEVAVVNYPEGESENVTLISPINGSTVAWNATFSWSSVSNATYTLEISDNSNFTTINHSSKSLTTNSATIDLYQLDASKTYYWRVRTSQSGKLEAVSNVATFKTPVKAPAPVVTLLTPANGAEIDDDFTFSWTGVDVESYLLQVSSKSDFSTIKYSQELTAGSSTMKSDIAISLLGKGTFYWRVISQHRHMTDVASEVRKFEITKVVIGNFEPGYQILTDIDSYDAIDGTNIESLWFRSVDERYDNITFGENGSYNRGFCAVGDYVYMAGRVENSSSSNIYLRKFDGKTGEIIGDIILGEEGKGSYYPCNDVIKDSKGNICITNLTLYIGSTPLKVYLVDVETGNLTEVASVTKTMSSTTRVDHAAIYGDVTTGNFSLYAAVAKSKTVIRWNFKNGELSSTETCTLKSLYPTSATGLGIAPQVIPVNEDQFLLNGGATFLTMYQFSTGKVVESFASKTGLAPIGYEANGGTYFNLANQNYIVYPYSDYSNGFHSFNLVKVNSSLNFSSMELMWKLPENGMGAVNSTTMQAEADYVEVDANSGIVYLFVPGNGICAYQIKNGNSSVDGININNAEISVNGSTVNVGMVVDEIHVYDMYGTEVAYGKNVKEVKLDVANGIYVVSASVNGETKTEKIIIK